ncbi:nitroreductase family protein [Desulfoluna spongiiphila]|uniref:Nitroreductase n=1 Tax=Desulfoluna spongiiphila TaxID=419481 RepID=A0A1G5F1W6_9BACT|nr:nitroreductase family protein [Desulfoluna spongiiphila]SCY33197.1 Nitroreductase [Desulfoluna spongiiphila]VVS94370.1 nitroreductase [Desulfoluna spongiiphila]
MKRPIHVVIDESKCTGCGACVAICPHDTLTLAEGKAVVTGDDSLSCGHCLAVCPTEAITLTDHRPMGQSYQTFAMPDGWLAPGAFEVDKLAWLMASRRSCRHFTKDPVPMAVLEDLVHIATTAPSGTNAQAWHFTLLPDRTSVKGFAKGVLSFFQQLNRLARIAPLRGLLKLLGKPELSRYHADYHDRIEEGIASWTTQHKDLLFHGAPAAILVSCSQDASCPAEDALLASNQILLAAHAMGLGSCLIGFAVEALARDKQLRQRISLPANETVYAVIALGHPHEPYMRPSVRKPVTPRVIRMNESNAF